MQEKLLPVETLTKDKILNVQCLNASPQLRRIATTDSHIKDNLLFPCRQTIKIMFYAFHLKIADIGRPITLMQYIEESLTYFLGTILKVPMNTVLNTIA